jgi:hypothetical protein
MTTERAIDLSARRAQTEAALRARLLKAYEASKARGGRGVPRTDLELAERKRL